MKIRYRILWIENEPEWVESIEDQLKDYVENLGFQYDRDLVGGQPQENNYGLYDLILMDLNLSSNPNGAELISQIRKLGVYTDVVFYSAVEISKLRDEGNKKELEGVYYSSRTPDENFVRKVLKVIDNTVKKTQDLVNLRGLVMAEVSDLDVLMEQNLNLIFEKEEYKTDFHKRITSKKEKDIRKNLIFENCERNCQLNWRNLSKEDLINTIDSYQKAHGVHIAIEMIEKEKNIKLYNSSNDSNFLENYNKDIISKRNILAHCQSYSTDGQFEILRTKKGELSFTNEDFVKIRKDIQVYKNLFLNIKDYLK